VEDEEIAEIVRESIEESIGLMINSRKITFKELEEDHQVARFTFNFPEIPASVIDSNAGFGEWLPPYRAKELVESELMDRLPDDLMFESEDKVTMVIYND
jgi:hypothetical protein